MVNRTIRVDASSTTQVRSITIGTPIRTVTRSVEGVTLTYTGDSGSDTFDLATGTLNLTGGTGLSSLVTNDVIRFDLDSTSVTPGSYGSATQIPTFTVDAQGRLTAAGSANVATNLTINGDSSTTDTISLLDSNLTFTGGTAISSLVTDNTVTISLDDTTVSPGSYGSQTEIPTFTVDQQGRLTAANVVNVATSLTVNGDGATSDTISLLDSSLTFVGDTAITATVTDNTVTIDLDDTVVTPGSYGSQTQIPTFTVDQQGRLTAADEVSVATVLNTVGDVGTGDVNLLDSSITFIGGTNINTIANGSSIVIHLDSAVSNLTSLTVDNISIDGNTISSTDGSNTLFIDPAPTDSDGGNLIVRGNLQVNGTTTTINSTTLSVNDKNITLADSAPDANAADGAGITISGANATILYDAATDRLDFNKPIEFSDSVGASIFFNNTAITEAIDTYLVNNRVATTTSLGLASFDSDQFTVTAGAVTIYDIDGGTF